MFAQLTVDPWWLWVAGGGAVIYLLIRPRHLLGVLILGGLVYVSWLLELPQLVGLLP